MKPSLVVLAGLSLFACSAATRAPDLPITLAGIKDIRLGTSIAQVVKESALDEPTYLHDKSCGEAIYNYPPLPISILAIDGRVARLSFAAEFENIPETSYVTPEGIRLGSTEQEVANAFPKAERDVDTNSGALTYLAWSKRGESGWLFEISSKTKRVIRVTVGDKSIEYYEGCA